jgi:hypothetical protein
LSCPVYSLRLLAYKNVKIHKSLRGPESRGSNAFGRELSQDFRLPVPRTAGTFVQKVSVPVEIFFQGIDLHLGHHIPSAFRTKMGVFGMAVGNQQISQFHHEILECNTGRAKKGAFPACQAIPYRLVINPLGIKTKPLGNRSGRSFVYEISSVECDHGADRRALSAFQTHVEMVLVYQVTDLLRKILMAIMIGFQCGIVHF